MTAEKLAYTISELNPESQTELFCLLSEFLTDNETRALQFMVSYFRIEKNPDLKKAMQETLAEQLYKKFNEME